MNHYLTDDRTGEPQNLLDLHYKYLDHFFPGKSIDWTVGHFKRTNLKVQQGSEVHLRRGSLSQHPINLLVGFENASFMRMVPRNNWYEKPYPRPLSHGNTSWQWNGYINWYDARTPRKKQYSWHTDRPRDMWPDLNRVYIHATQGYGNDRLFFQFETYTPNFCHFEVDENDTGWSKVGKSWIWILKSGKNILRARAVNKLGAKGKPSVVIVNHVDTQLGQ